MRLLAAYFLLLLVSCKSNRGQYVNHNKWAIPGIYEQDRIKDKPKEVKVSHYPDLADTSFSGSLTGKFNDYTIYRFDKEGNIVFTRIFIDSTFIFDAYYTFNDNGEQYEFLSYGKGDTDRTSRVSRKIGEGKFQSEKYRNRIKSYTDIISFFDDGNKIVTERRSGDTLLGTETLFYKEDKLFKAIEKSRDLETEQTYYYSSGGLLDSIIMKRSDAVSKRTLFVNNENGDPVYSEESDKSGNNKRQWIKYEYDEKGNWVRQITKGEGWNEPRLNNFNEKIKFPGYSLLVREIKYQANR